MHNNHLILMHKMTKCHPQEWAALVPWVEYLYFTAPQGRSGLSARDLMQGCALASAVDRRRMPFLQPEGLAETDVAARLFDNWRQLMILFTTLSSEAATKSAEYENRTRHIRRMIPGELVYRKNPPATRQPKHLFPPPSTGPYRVVKQHSLASFILRKV